jgi:transcriptional regulator with XRE-family HTH domain
MKSIHTELYQERNRQGLTQAEVGSRMGARASQISHWEQGANVRSDLLYRWVAALGLRLRLDEDDTWQSRHAAALPQDEAELTPEEHTRLILDRL